MRLLPLLLMSMSVVACGQNPTVSIPVRISLDGLSKSASETTGAATLDGREILGGFVDFRADGTIKNAFSVTSNGGLTWKHLVLRPPAAFQDNLEADPMTAYDVRTNTLFAGGISRAKCIYVAKKISGQNAFGPSQLAVQSSWPDKGWMAAGPRYKLPNTTRLYVTYNEGIIWSDDLGTTWTPPRSLGTGYGFLPRVGPQGELYLTYWDGYWGIMFSRSIDGGTTWSTPIQPGTRMTSWGVENYGIPGTFRNFTNNTMAVNPSNGDIVILWVDQTNIINGQKNLDLYMVRSSDRGVSWTNAERLPFRPLGQISDMIFPWVEFTKDGRLHLFAMDTSLNPGQTDGVDHGLWDQVYYYSEDSGATWSPRFRLTSNSWDSFFHGTGTAKFLGDYQGMAISQRAIYPVYPNTGSGEAEVFVNQIYNPIERPGMYNWTVGSQASGTIASLYLRDANMAQAAPVQVTNYGETAQLETSFAVPTSTPSLMKVCLWSQASCPGLQQQIQLRSALTGLWDSLDIRPATTSMSNTTLTIPAPSNYISTNKVRVRVVLKSVLRRPTRPWLASIDQNVLIVEP